MLLAKDRMDSTYVTPRFYPKFFTRVWLNNYWTMKWQESWISAVAIEMMEIGKRVQQRDRPDETQPYLPKGKILRGLNCLSNVSSGLIAADYFSPDCLPLLVTDSGRVNMICGWGNVAIAKIGIEVLGIR